MRASGIVGGDDVEWQQTAGDKSHCDTKSVEMANQCLPNETDLPLTGNHMLVGMDSSHRSLRYVL